MTNYKLRNNNYNQAEPSKPTKTSTTTRSVDTSASSPSRSSEDQDSFLVAERLVKSISSDIMQTANSYRETGRTTGVVSRAGARSVASNNDSFEDPADDDPVADESKTHWVDNNSEDQVNFSIDEVKRMVLESIPRDVRDMIPADAWGRIFKEGADSVLSEDIMSLQKNSTAEDVNDLVSFISVYVQREARGRPRGDSDVSEMTYPNVDPPPRRTSRMDAVALALDSIPPSVEGQEEDAYIDSPPQSRKSPHVPIPSAVGAPKQPAPVATPSRDDQSVSSAPSLGENSRANRNEIKRNSILAPPRDLQERKIGFSRVEIRYYEQILGDNPAVTAGPPIGIGWKYRIMKKDMTVDAWEHRQRPHRRYLTALVTTRHERTSMLYDLGYKQKEVALAVRDVLRIKNKRKQTFNNLRFQSMEEVVEKVGRRFKSALTLGYTSRKQKELLAPFKSGRSAY